MSTNANSGKIIFSKIEQLPPNWIDDPSSVWTVWDKNTYYLWGANSMNYDLKQGDGLMGAGMAGSNGPTLGYAHDHYVGLDTMDYSTTRNPGVFKKLETLLLAGNDIVVPTFKGCYSLGTGIAHENPGWQKIQLQIMEGLVSLVENASAMETSDDTFWPDCRTQVSVSDGRGGNRMDSICSRVFRPQLDAETIGAVKIKTVEDLKIIVAKLT